MSIVQKIKGNQRTFEDIAKSVFNRILHDAVGSKRVDVIFDVYCDISIKNIERAEKRRLICCAEVTKYSTEAQSATMAAIS